MLIPEPQLPYSTLEWVICVASLLNLKYCALHITAHETIFKISMD